LPLFASRHSEKIPQMSPEIMVSITDFALAVFSGVLTAKLLSRPTAKPRTRRWFALVLGAIAFGSLLGGISHGLLPEESGRAGGLIWRATLMAIGPAAVGLWMLASILLFRPSSVERSRTLALIVLAVYVGVVLFEYQNFLIALLLYVPAAVLLLVAFAVHLKHSSDTFAIDGLIAMGITLVAGVLQYLRVGLHPVYFNHNALYHLCQAVGLFFLYRAAIKWLGTESPGPSHLKSPSLVAKIG
jgi:hypothetical protein